MWRRFFGMVVTEVSVLKKKELRSFEPFGTSRPNAQSHIPEDTRLRHRRCGNHTWRNPLQVQKAWCGPCKWWHVNNWHVPVRSNPRHSPEQSPLTPWKDLSPFENYLLGYYAASSSNTLPTFRGNLSVPSSRVKNPPRKVGTRCVITQKNAVFICFAAKPKITHIAICTRSSYIWLRSKPSV